LIKAFSQRLLLRFLIVGGASTVVNYGIYTVLYLGAMVHYDVAFIVGFMSGVVVGYLLNRAWTFQVRSGNHSRDVWRYLITYTASLLSGLACVRWIVEDLSVDPLLANLCVICMTTFINYCGTRFWVFNR